MHGFVATGGPAGALLNPQGVIGTTNQQSAAAHLLDVALHAQVRVADGQELGVHRTVSRMTNRATFA